MNFLKNPWGYAYPRLGTAALKRNLFWFQDIASDDEEEDEEDESRREEKYNSSDGEILKMIFKNRLKNFSSTD